MCSREGMLYVETILMSSHNIPFLIYKKKITLNFPSLQSRDYNLATQEQVRNSHG